MVWRNVNYALRRGKVIGDNERWFEFELKVNWKRKS